ncbi:MAG: DUF1549 domain-containing protein, partial [Pirellulaceae bacterium]
MRLRFNLLVAGFVLGLAWCQQARADQAADFQDRVAPILQRRCLSCHGPDQAHGGLSLATRDLLFSGGESGEVVLPGDADSSYLLEMITPHGGKAAMPKNADPLSVEEIATIRVWIQSGADWPEGVTLSVAQVTDTDWWSLRPLSPIEPPQVTGQVRTLQQGEVTLKPLMGEHPIDRFVAEKHQELGLSFGPVADRQTLVRRLYFDLIGLPPTPDEVRRFMEDPDPAAYEKLVDTLLSSPHYGERWARHWLDVVHFGDTHGYDKDKPRPNAWPYRDYVIRSLNQGKPWSRFIEEQLAGDVLYPGTADGIEALGFISAGPWDYVGHAEVAESKTDGKIARHLDRDDMVRTAIQSFNGLTIGCAQCHNHKFDPISQEQYYQLHAVFAAVDRADKEYFREPETAEQYASLTEQQQAIIARQEGLKSGIEAMAGQRLAELDKQIEELRRQQPRNSDARFGYHSAIEARDDVTKWVQIDLGSTVSPEVIFLRPAYDDFNGIGAGFGFPRRFRIEISDDPQFLTGVHLVADQQADDLPNPGTTPQRFPIKDIAGRYVRLTATKLAPRQNDFILALAEFEVLVGQDNWAQRGQVSSLDSIEAPPRWGQANLNDAVHPATAEGEADTLQAERDQLWQQATSPEVREQWAALARDLKEVESALAALPKPQRVYAGTVHHGSGAFAGRGAVGGEPRPIHLLHRGEVTSPGKLVEPAALEIFPGHPGRFDLPEGHAEGERRAALAQWLSSQDNPLTWRTIANRVWQYHFGQGLAETPGDLGRQGAKPTHPRLLDFLAVQLRDGDQSLKTLHRLIVTSHTYRQASTLDDPAEPTTAQALDTDVNN